MLCNAMADSLKLLICEMSLAQRAQRSCGRSKRGRRITSVCVSLRRFSRIYFPQTSEDFSILLSLLRHSYVCSQSLLPHSCVCSQPLALSMAPIPMEQMKSLIKHLTISNLKVIKAELHAENFSYTPMLSPAQKRTVHENISAFCLAS